MNQPHGAWTRDQLLKRFPDGELVRGWFFRVEEVSAGCYRVEAADRFGRLVGLEDSDPDVAIEECMRRIRQTDEQLRS